MNILKKLFMEPETNPEPLMTPDEFLYEMQRIFVVYNYKGDHEGAHRAADRLMRDILESIGYGDGVEIFRKCNIQHS